MSTEQEKKLAADKLAIEREHLQVDKQILDQNDGYHNQKWWYHRQVYGRLHNGILECT